ncbi:MAG: hypothetical protein OXF23_04270, partial [Candidatus Dadabacteria bacterium]|nr:hypothetical protein [Candidatus Dadabacteria bacterium]
DLGWQVSGLPSGCAPTETTNNPSPPSTEPEPEPELDPDPEEELPSPASPDQSGGGCALASGKTKDHGQTAPLYLLLGTFAIFTALSRKNRSATE